MSTPGAAWVEPHTAAASGPLLTVTGLEVDYLSGGQFTPAVRGANFSVGRGEVVALVGESGSGKSTIALAVLGLLPPGGIVTGGRMEFDGIDLVGLRERRWRRIRGSRIGLVPQDPTVSLNPVKRIGDQIAEGMRIQRALGRRAAHADALELLDSVGIDRPTLRAQQYPHELSGGMRQRALIGIALSCNPELIIADEPTSALDVTVQRTVLDSLQSLIAQRGTSVLLITHDLGIAVDRADRIIVMSQGEIVEEGPALDVVRNPRHGYTKQLIDDAPSLTTLSGAVATRESPDPATAPSLAPLVEVTGLEKVFKVVVPNVGHTEIRAVDRIDLSVRRGLTTALVGESGSGKSTTARLIAGLEAPTSGTVTFDGLDLRALRGEERRRARTRIKFVYQNPYASLDPRFTIAEVIEEPLKLAGVTSREARLERVREILELVALPVNFLKRRPGELSGGQRQRVAIARALVTRPEFVILDEPVSALDVTVQAQILDLLLQSQRELGLTYLFISHDLAVVARVAEHVAVMQDGRIVEQGDTAELFAAPQNAYTQRLLDAIPGERART